MCTNTSVIRPYRPSRLPRVRKGTGPRSLWIIVCLALGMIFVVVFSNSPLSLSKPSATDPIRAIPAAETETLAERSIAELAAWSYYGDAAASFELGRRLEFGLGTDSDPSEAAHWYATAEEQGHPLPKRVLERLFP